MKKCLAHAIESKYWKNTSFMKKVGGGGMAPATAPDLSYSTGWI